MADADRADRADGQADGPLQSGCSGSDASFCIDFSSDGAFSSPTWSRIDGNGDAGTISVATDSFVSPPRAASFVVPAAAPLCTYLRMSRDFAGAYGRAAARLVVRAENKEYFLSFTASSSQADASYQTIVSIDDGGGATARLQKFVGGVLTEVGSTRASFSPTGLGRWVVVEVEYLEAAGMLHVTVDGAAAPAISLPSDFILAAPTLSVGPHCTSGPMTMLADDVSVVLGK